MAPSKFRSAMQRIAGDVALVGGAASLVGAFSAATHGALAWGQWRASIPSQDTAAVTALGVALLWIGAIVRRRGRSAAPASLGSGEIARHVASGSRPPSTSRPEEEGAAMVRRTSQPGVRRERGPK